MSSSLEWKDKPVKYLRDQVVDQLKYNLVNSHLEIEEFEQRVKVALSTQSKAELLSLINDLPAKEQTEIMNQRQGWDVEAKEESMTNILSESKRKEMGVFPKQFRLLNVLGEAEIDLRKVQLGLDLRYLTLRCWLGAVKVIVPPEINVVSNIKNVLSAVDSLNQRRIDPDAPTIVIDGKVILGEVKLIVRGKEID